ncbi:MAG: HD domain-containing protein [Acidimicrobiales bacterium]
MAGHRSEVVGLRQAHAGPTAPLGATSILDRAAREAAEHDALAPAATRSAGAGDRRRAEEPDPWRTCFERDRDRILHATAFRRLAGKTQVFVFPADHQRTRLTHALEVAQIARSLAAALRLNVALAEAIALGHDCGHGPFGHASEDALDPLAPGGFDHAPWGADITLAPLNLTREVSDGIRNHSWSRPPPVTPEGEVCSLADRMAYATHDAEDAARAGIVDLDDLPGAVLEVVGRSRSRQLDTFVTDVVLTSQDRQAVGMSADPADALAALREWCYQRIYLRPESVTQAGMVHRMLRALVEHYVAHPDRLPDRPDLDRDGERQRAAVGYVAGMTDRFACAQAAQLLGWRPSEMPAGFDTSAPPGDG